VFFAGENIGEKPRETIFILPKRFEADCDKDQPDKFKTFCYDLVSSIMKSLWDFKAEVDRFCDADEVV